MAPTVQKLLKKIMAEQAPFTEYRDCKEYLQKSVGSPLAIAHLLPVLSQEEADEQLQKLQDINLDGIDVTDSYEVLRLLRAYGRGINAWKNKCKVVYPEASCF